MSTYHCGICFHKFDEEKEGKKFADVPESWRCPLCMAPKSAFVADGPVSMKVEGVTAKEGPKDLDLSYQSDLIIEDGGKMDYIHELALTGRSPGEAMETLMPVKAFDALLGLSIQWTSSL